MAPINLSQGSLVAFLTCKRRFQLRYLLKMPWPDLPLPEEVREAIDRGHAFHRAVERHFLRLQPSAPLPLDAKLQLWWRRFEEHMRSVPQGRLLPELRLTIPAGDHFLTGRFDLVAIQEDIPTPAAQIYDWKTSKPLSTAELKESWQSILYLALLAQSKGALLDTTEELQPSDLTLTYWYVSDPQEPRILPYSGDQHQANWTKITQTIEEIDLCVEKNDWPLTDNWNHCRSCAYRTYCDRDQDGADLLQLAEEALEYEVDPLFSLEPARP